MDVASSLEGGGGDLFRASGFEGMSNFIISLT